MITVTDSGTGVAAPFNVPCYLAGTLNIGIRKYKVDDISLMGTIATPGLNKIKSMVLIPDSTFVAFGVNQAVLGLADYKAMALYRHTLLHLDSPNVDYLTDSRVVITGVIGVGGKYIDVVAFNQINPNRCLAFKNSFGLLCASCSPGTFLFEQKCQDNCPQKYFSNPTNNICEQCGENC